MDRKDCIHPHRLPLRAFVQRGLRSVFSLLSVVAAVSVTLAYADEPPAAMFTYGGFGTLGVVHSDQPDADFISSPFEATGAGHTHPWSAAVDSLIGAQVAATLTPRLSAVLQVIAQQNYDDTFRPHVEWANIKYQFTPDFSMRLGRTALPLFVVTDSRNVGFANPWVRPPIELYGLVSVTTNDGIDASYRHPVGDASNTVQMTLGRANYKYPVPDSQEVGAATATDQVSLVDSYERGSATLRLTYGQAHVTIPTFNALFDAFRQFGLQGVGIADKYDVNERIISFFGLSLDYEPGEWFAMAEWGRVNGHSAVGEKTGWYVSAGYRFGKLTPYLTYADVRANSSTYDPGLDLAALPPSSVAVAQALNAGLNASLASIASQRTFSVGARYDLTHSVDLKLQIDRTVLGANSQGWLTNLQPGFQRGSSLTLVSATLDFVF